MTRTAGGPVRRALRLLAQDRPRASLAIALNTAAILSNVGLLATSAWLISRAALHPSIAVLQVAIVGVRFFGLTRGVFRYAERLVSHDVTLRLLERLRVHVYASLEPLAPARLLRERSGDLLARLTADVDTLEHLYVRVVGPSATAVLVTALTVGLLARHHGQLALALVVGLSIAGIAAPLLSWRAGEAATRVVVDARGDLQARLVDALDGGPELVALGREDLVLTNLRARAHAVADTEMRTVRAAASGGALATASADLTMIAVLALAIPLVIERELPGVQLAVVALTALAAFEAVAGLPAAWQGAAAARQAATRLFELLDARPEVTGPPQPLGVPRGTRLEIHNLDFAYPGSDVRALSDLSMTLAAGRLVALVGANGSGKTTVAHVLMRFWDVPRGAITLDGTDVRELAPEDVRARVAFAPSRSHVFTGSIADNLRVAHPGASDADLQRAAALVGLDTLLERLPDGHETWVGEQGHALSGGERQRLTIARALLKPDAPFLLLDEPTAHIDPVGERRFFARLRALADAGRGVLLITHRLTGLGIADEVVVLRRGRIVQRGTFETLAGEPGWFASMLAIQRSVDALGSDGEP